MEHLDYGTRRNSLRSSTCAAQRCGHCRFILRQISIINWAYSLNFILLISFSKYIHWILSSKKIYLPKWLLILAWLSYKNYKISLFVRTSSTGETHEHALPHCQTANPKPCLLARRASLEKAPLVLADRRDTSGEIASAYQLECSVAQCCQRKHLSLS